MYMGMYMYTVDVYFRTKFAHCQKTPVIPVRVVSQHLDRLRCVANVPELGLAVVATAGQVILLVRIVVEISHQLSVRVLDTVSLPESDIAKINRYLHVWTCTRTCTCSYRHNEQI